MNLYYKIFTTILFFILVAYLFHSFKVKSESFLHTQNSMVTKIHELHTLELDINGEILQSAFYLYFNYDGLNKKIKSLSSAIENILKHEIFKNIAYEKLFEKIKVYEKKVNKKITSIREYQSLNSGMKNSVSYLSILIEKLDSYSGFDSLESQNYHKDSARLLSIIFLAKNSMDIDMLFNADLLLQKLSKYQTQNSKEHNVHRLFLSNASFFILNFEKYVNTVNSILKIENHELTLELLEDLHESSHEKESSLENILLLLIFFFIAMTILIVYFIYSADRKNKELISLEKINIQKEHMIFQKSRQAQMGEMLSMISHQWRQPLSAISMTSNVLKSKFMLESYDLHNEDDQRACTLLVDESLNKINGFIESLSTTIDDFRNFYKPNRLKKDLPITVPLENACKIVKATLEAGKISINVNNNSTKKLPLHDNELMQVFLNFFKNAEDNFSEKKIAHPIITITSEDIENGIRITIGDNGGGIPEEVQQKIFDPYFSTKNEKNGTGLGLYMSKIIVEDHHHGKLLVQNNDEGVDFIIEIYTS